jgi:hypothetical protein
MYVFYQMKFCRHCFAHGGVPQVARAVIEFQMLTGHLPESYGKLKNASTEQRVRTRIPDPLWWGEWDIVSLEELSRFAVVYRADRKEQILPEQEIRELLQEPPVEHATATLPAVFCSGYELSSTSSIAVRLFSWDVVNFRRTPEIIRLKE